MKVLFFLIIILSAINSNIATTRYHFRSHRKRSNLAGTLEPYARKSPFPHFIMADYADTSEYADTLPQNGAETTQQNNAIEQTNQGMGDASQEGTKSKPGDKIHASKDEDDGT